MAAEDIPSHRLSKIVHRAACYDVSCVETTQVVDMQHQLPRPASLPVSPHRPRPAPGRGRGPMRRRQRRGRPGPRLRLGEAFLLLDDNVSANKEYDNPQCRRFAGNKTACVFLPALCIFPCVCVFLCATSNVQISSTRAIYLARRCVPALVNGDAVAPAQANEGCEPDRCELELDGSC